MQKKILSVVLSLFLAGSASSAFAGFYDIDVDIDDSFNKEVDVDINKSWDIDVDVDKTKIINKTKTINKTYDNDVFDVDNDDGAVLNQYVNGAPMGDLYSFQENGPRGMGLPTAQMSGNVASQVNNATGDISSIAIGNMLSIEDSFNRTRNSTRNHTRNLDIDVDVDIEDSFNVDDSFNQSGFPGGLQLP
ncbi:MAG: hypothetical protein NPINA01_20900 [Nitrospinaceae bacterium]|nr:MAG: hypothetical protein NPINA01_20900 [Nitrospinaceae bacterium]